MSELFLDIKFAIFSQVKSGLALRMNTGNFGFVFLNINLQTF